MSGKEQTGQTPDFLKALTPTKSILFVCTSVSSFVKNDIEIFQQEGYQVSALVFNWYPKWKLPFVLLKQFFQLLVKVPTSTLVVVQLAGLHSFLPMVFAKFFNKPSLIFLGGTDCAKFPSINYGNFNKPLLGFFTAWSVKLATHLAPKHESLIYFDYNYDDKDYPSQGVKCFVRNFNTPYSVIHNGYNTEKFKCISTKKKNTFLTVAAGIAIPNTIPLKGIDLILEVAPFFPQCMFTIVGVPPGFRLSNQSSNIHVLPELPNEELVKLYSEHEFYLQLSMSEGFPNAICEAMLCECIPIGSNVNALPDIIAETGYVLARRSSKMLEEILAKALACQNNEELKKNARKHILTHFSLSERKNRLNDLILTICPAQR